MYRYIPKIFMLREIKTVFHLRRKQINQPRMLFHMLFMMLIHILRRLLEKGYCLILFSAIMFST